MLTIFAYGILLLVIFTAICGFWVIAQIMPWYLTTTILFCVLICLFVAGIYTGGSGISSLADFTLSECAQFFVACSFI